MKVFEEEKTQNPGKYALMLTLISKDGTTILYSDTVENIDSRVAYVIKTIQFDNDVRMTKPTKLNIRDLTIYTQSPIPPSMKLLIEVNATIIPVEFGGKTGLTNSNELDVHLPPTSHIIIILDRKGMRI